MKVCILGLGKTGKALARYWQNQKAQVWGIDDNPALPGEVDLELFSSATLPELHGVDHFYISPGIDPKHPAAQKAINQGLKLEGELDLAFSLAKGKKILAITGTNGKSTTVSLLGEILQRAGQRVGIGGNLGTPFIELVTDPQNFTHFVVEVSSYQLETTEKFRPDVAALLNITDDHLDRYTNLRAYSQAKGKLFAFQNSEDFAVFNDDDLHVLEVLEWVSKPRRIPFSITKKVHGAYAGEKNILWAPGTDIAASFDLSQTALSGLHNLENIACAVACAKAIGVANDAIQEAIDQFKGLPHRLEWVAKIDEVNYFDDSKGTNVGAVVMSLASFDQDVVLILGGRDKGGEYTPLIPLLKHKARAVLVMGEAKDLIIQALKGACEIIAVASINEAVQTAHRLAPPGGTVLLSPACSSFDMFRDYHDRGEQFKVAVKKLLNKNA